MLLRSNAWRDAAVATLVVAVIALVIDPALAQQNPFGAPRSTTPSPQPPDGIVGWILAKQGEFYKQFSGLIRASKQDGSAAWTLLGLSFLYGIFHAAGPGHGKAVISSYIVANDETWWRGVVLSFASAFMQAAVAVAIVGVAVALLGATSRAMQTTVYWIEVISYALIALIGARLVWTKGRGLLASLRSLAPQPAPALAVAGHAHHHHDHAHDHHHHDHAHHSHAHDHGHKHDHGHHDHHNHSHAHHDHAQCTHDHVHDEHCGHNHGPTPDQLAGPGGWKRGLTAIFSVGLRPCSGAILVLVFALAQGLFWIGAAATFVMGLGTAITVAAIATLAVSAKALAAKLASGQGGYGSLAVRGVEFAAAVVILAFGVLLLMGYIASERLGMA
ncbi:nickel/cobalt efflux protein RcnA [Variibacter gotjawalensis]|uniref:Nickel/cobalt efflux system n=1 Tax=Variibacter gotjawalensis TaxID=1333996 RepID=A0A0S3PVL1_9BRAD|nr:nickel/cobalt transporter [Variibacter gotjawalensis]NIK45767.1 nickel/cobalt exporter [Variibacter gotjawalensis]RZS47691.1 ABC-type nickel/cobalt efflux system permease component RcnA [Variibacter gotjawalensis]BAT59944.1 nickel/cobalt efflux protein RcnA [Variibacter gotjawalensis]